MRCTLQRACLRGPLPSRQPARCPTQHLTHPCGLAPLATPLQALHYAAFKGHTAVIEALLANHACPDSADKRQWSPAHIAAQEGQTDALLALLRGGANSTSRTGNGNTPLHVAAQEGHASTVRALLQQAPGSVQTVNSAGQSALHCAAGKGRGAAVQALLEVGASAGALDSCGDTALHRCVAGWRQDRLAQYMACAKALLEAGADPAAANQQHQTPLDLAAGRGIAPLLRDLAEELGGNGQLDASDACATRRNVPGSLLATLGPVETKRNLPDQRGGRAPGEVVDCMGRWVGWGVGAWRGIMVFFTTCLRKQYG